MKKKTFDMIDSIVFWIAVPLDVLCVVMSVIAGNYGAMVAWLLVVLLQFRIRQVEKELREKPVEVLVLVDRLPGNEE